MFTGTTTRGAYSLHLPHAHRARGIRHLLCTRHVRLAITILPKCSALLSYSSVLMCEGIPRREALSSQFVIDLGISLGTWKGRIAVMFCGFFTITTAHLPICPSMYRFIALSIFDWFGRKCCTNWHRGIIAAWQPLFLERCYVFRISLSLSAYPRLLN